MVWDGVSKDCGWAYKRVLYDCVYLMRGWVIVEITCAVTCMVPSNTLLQTSLLFTSSDQQSSSVISTSPISVTPPYRNNVWPYATIKRNENKIRRIRSGGSGDVIIKQEEWKGR